MNRKLLAAPVLALALAACGGHSTAGHTGSVAVESPRSQTLPALLAAVGCKPGTVDDESGEMFTADGKGCTADVGDVTVYTFADKTNRDRWFDVARQMGGGFVVGDRWIVKVDSTSAAQTVQPRVGGKVES